MTNVWIRSLLLITFDLLFVSTYAEVLPANFRLEVRGQRIGTASYTFTKPSSGTLVKADYSFALGATKVDCSREAKLGPDDSLQSDTLQVQSGKIMQTVTITANAATGNSTTRREGVVKVTNHFDLEP